MLLLNQISYAKCLSSFIKIGNNNQKQIMC